MIASPEGEATRAPDAVIVHDPVPCGALEPLLAEPDEERMRERFQFRQRPDPEAFSAQHQAFVRAVQEAGTRTLPLAELVADDPAREALAANCNQVYTRDAAITLPWAPGTYIAGRLKAAIRRPERRVMAAALERLGLRRIADVPEGLVLEGGDVVPFARHGRRWLLVAHGPRTSREALEFLAGELIPEHADAVLGIELPSWRINLDGALVPVAEDVVVAHPDSVRDGVMIDATGNVPVDPLATVRSLEVAVVEVTKEESVYQEACNFLALGERQAVCYDLAPRLVPLLAAHDVRAIPVPGSELVKGTGGPRCMSRPIYGAGTSR